MNTKVQAFLRRKYKTNTIAKLNSSRPRLIVSRSNKHIHAQVIDANGNVVASAYDTTVSWTKSEKAYAVWQAVWNAAKDQGVSEVVFDRNWYLYHWRVAKLAEGAREAWLVF